MELDANIMEKAALPLWRAIGAVLARKAEAVGSMAKATESAAVVKNRLNKNALD